MNFPLVYEGAKTKASRTAARLFGVVAQKGQEDQYGDQHGETSN